MPDPSWNTDKDRQIRLVGFVGEVCVGLRNRGASGPTRLLLACWNGSDPSNQQGTQTRGSAVYMERIRRGVIELRPTTTGGRTKINDTDGTEGVRVCRSTARIHEDGQSPEARPQRGARIVRPAGGNRPGAYRRRESCF